MPSVSFDEKPKVRVLISSDIVLECFTNFNGQVEDVEELLQLVQLQRIQAFVTDYCLQKVGFYLSKPHPHLGQEVVSKIRVLLNDRIIYINRQIIDDAINSSIQNFDAAIEVMCATEMNLGAIVTQYPELFSGTSLSTLTTDDFVKRQCLEEKLQHSTTPCILKSSLRNFKNLEENLQKNHSFQVNLFGTNSRNNLVTLDLQGTDLREVNLSGVILRGADLRRTDLQGAILTFASLSFAKLSGANLQESDLRGANLSLAMLSESDLSFANLSNTNLSCSDLSNAQLCETNLQGSDLQGADLQNANLQGANLQAAQLKNTNFQEANVTLAKFGQNTGLSEALKVELICRGAIFLEDRFGDRSISIHR
jgi:uncharacterized protein YjbI with pentapeptide repeats